MTTFWKIEFQIVFRSAVQVWFFLKCCVASRHLFVMRTTKGLTRKDVSTIKMKGRIILKRGLIGDSHFLLSVSILSDKIVWAFTYHRSCSNLGLNQLSHNPVIHLHATKQSVSSRTMVGIPIFRSTVNQFGMYIRGLRLFTSSTEINFAQIFNLNHFQHIVQGNIVIGILCQNLSFVVKHRELFFMAVPTGNQNQNFNVKSWETNLWYVLLLCRIDSKSRPTYIDLNYSTSSEPHRCLLFAH